MVALLCPSPLSLPCSCVVTCEVQRAAAGVGGLGYTQGPWWGWVPSPSLQPWGTSDCITCLHAAQVFHKGSAERGGVLLLLNTVLPLWVLL